MTFILFLNLVPVHIWLLIQCKYSKVLWIKSAVSRFIRFGSKGYFAVWKWLKILKIKHPTEQGFLEFLYIFLEKDGEKTKTWEKKRQKSTCARLNSYAEISHLMWQTWHICLWCIEAGLFKSKSFSKPLRLLLKIIRKQLSCNMLVYPLT